MQLQYVFKKKKKKKKKKKIYPIIIWILIFFFLIQRKEWTLNQCTENFRQIQFLFKFIKMDSLFGPNFKAKGVNKQGVCACVRSSSGRIYFWQIIGFSEQVNSITTALTSHIAADWLLLPLLRNNSCDAAFFCQRGRRESNIQNQVFL